MRRLVLCFPFAAAFFAIAGCGGGGASSSSITITTSPTSASVAVGKTQQFTAMVTGTTNMAVGWTVAGSGADGSISSTGLYTAPATVPTPAQVTVTATSVANPVRTATAVVTVTGGAGSGTTVTVSPGSANVSNFGTQQFNATVTGNSNTAVTWKVNGMAGGNRSLGFISSSGLFVAPGGVPTTSDGQGGSTTTTLTIAAVSQADSTASGSAAVTLVPANQNSQTGAIVLGASGGNANDSNTNATNHTITCCGGTLGSLVTRGGTQFVLSNNHVLARSDAATVGDAIISPGLIDVNCNAAQGATVANLTQFVNLENEVTSMTPAKNIDAAIAQVVSGKVNTSGNILYLGATADANGVPVSAPPEGGAGTAASVGMQVAKSGRSTGLTCSSVEATNIITNVEYTKNCDGTGATFTVPYQNLIGVTGGGFSAEGDSGSLIVTQAAANPVALLFAGSDTDTVANPVSNVLSFFASGSSATTFVGGGAHQVIGCSLPNAPQSAAKSVQAASLSTEVMQRAVSARDAHASELMAHAEVQAVGVGASYDNPVDPAIVFFVTKGQPHTDIPAQVDGVRTRIVEGDLFAQRGSLSAEQSAQLEKSVAAPQTIAPISDVEYKRALAVHTAHAGELMKLAGVHGVGITASLDSPGESALIVFVTRGVPHDPIPPLVDGVRTRVRVSDRFRANRWGAESHNACKVPPAAQHQSAHATSTSQNRGVVSSQAAN